MSVDARQAAGEGWPCFPLRLAPAAGNTPEQAEALGKTPTLPDGTVRNIFRTFAWHPTLLKRLNAYLGTFMRFNQVSAYDREVIVLRVATTVRCRYEMGQHLPIAVEAGLDESTIRAVVSGDGQLGEHESLLVQATDEFLASGYLSDDVWAGLSERYDEASLVELVALIGQYRMIGDLLNVFGVQLEADIAAEFSRWLEDGRPEEISGRQD
ncbi:carboxymuconolactone decarboxylase family protein [Streptomyces sp. NPDC050388]|uniref:carboxymuconolactone decarboxylase family protein n=1 Tax=Streptomyces sp. NPDC050388 TaxID=3155781 RepID=UPI003445FC41